MTAPLFRVHADVLPPEAMERMSRYTQAARGRVRVDQGGFALLASRWLPLDRAPTCEVEALIHDHMLGSFSDLEQCAGIEWWWLIFDAAFTATGHMHFDNSLYSPSGYCLAVDPTAELETPIEVGVFYLTDGSAHTIVSTARATDRQAAMEHLARGQAQPHAIAVRPAKNRLLIFEGACLHGTLTPADPSDAGGPPHDRITLVVNTWRTRPSRPWWWY